MWLTLEHFLKLPNVMKLTLYDIVCQRFFYYMTITTVRKCKIQYNKETTLQTHYPGTWILTPALWNSPCFRFCHSTPHSPVQCLWVVYLLPGYLWATDPGSWGIPGWRRLPGGHGQENNQTVSDPQVVQCGLRQKQGGGRSQVTAACYKSCITNNVHLFSSERL